MNSLTSTFLPKSPRSMNHKVQERPQSFISMNSFSSHFHHISKHIAQTHESILVKLREQIGVTRGEDNKQSSFLNIIFHSLDEFICTHIDSPLDPSVDPNLVLSGVFSPVHEQPPTPCEVVEGYLPSCLDGAYIRNGPNPQFVPRGPHYLFDGDGMLHMVKISKGQATFCSRYVKTYKFNLEHEMGYSYFPSPFSSFTGLIATLARSMLTFARIFSGQFNPITNGYGTANTSLALFADNLFALCESDLPYALEVTSDGDIVTLGRCNFHSTTPFYRMTAHPKIDPITKEAFAYTYNLTQPFLTFFRIDSEGKKQQGVQIFSLEKITIIHDFALTKNYAIFSDIQMVANPLDIVRGSSPIRVDPTKIPRLGIIPRYAEDDSEMWWVDVPGFNMMHCVNSWEEDDGNKIVFVGSNIASIDQILTNMKLADYHLEMITINVKEKTVMRQPLPSISLEMGAINPAYLTKKNRYVYAEIVDSSTWVSGVAKLDLSLSSSTNHAVDSIISTHKYNPGCYGSDLCYVAKDPDNPNAEEDDGYVMTFIHDENTRQSKYLIMDAKSPNLDIVAVLKLPNRVPLGFHGLFISEKNLNKLSDSTWKSLDDSSNTFV